MQLSKKVSTLILFCILSFSLTLRSSFVPAGGGDTWGMSNYAVILSSQGTLIGVMNTLSYFGLYPYSYPMGGFVMVSSFFIITGLPITSVVYLYSVIIGVLGIFIVYIVAREVFPSNYIPLFVMAFFSTYIFYTVLTWNRVGARGLFTVIYPVVLFFLLRSFHSRVFSPRYWFLSILVFIVTLAIHRMAIFILIIIIVPLIINAIYSRTLNYFNHAKISTFVFNKNIPIVIFGSIFVLESSGFYLLQSLGVHPAYNFGHEGYYSSGSFLLNNILNMGYFYISNYSISAGMVILGLIYLLGKSNQNDVESLFLLILFFIVPFSYIVKYFYIFLGPLAVIYAGFGIKQLEKSFVKNQKWLYRPFGLFFLLGTLGVLSYVYEKVNTPWVFLIMGGGIFLMGMSALYEHRHLVLNRKKSQVFVLGLCLVAVSQVSVFTIYKSLDYLSNEEKHIRLQLELAENETFSPVVNSAVWISRYDIDPWLAFNLDSDLVISTLSGVSVANEKNDYHSNAIFYEEFMEAKFDIFKLFEGGKYPYHIQKTYRYEVDFIQHNAVLKNDTALAGLFGIKYFVFTTQQVELQGEENRTYEIIPYLVKERYVLYSDSYLMIYSFD